MIDKMFVVRHGETSLIAVDAIQPTKAPAQVFGKHGMMKFGLIPGMRPNETIVRGTYRWFHEAKASLESLKTTL